MKCLKRGVVAWLTGLPSSGKTTLAVLTAGVLREWGYRVEVLDGDWFRSIFSSDLGFTRDERRVHLVRAAWVARLLASNGVVVIAAFVSPYRDVRWEVRRVVEEGGVKFLEVYVRVPLEVAISRDSKGLYARAMRGELRNFTGIDDPYEEPVKPDLVIDNAFVPVEENVKLLAEFIARHLEV